MRSPGLEGTGIYDRQLFTYTRLDQLKSIVDNAGNTWTYGYDLRGRQTLMKDPDKGQTDSRYDDAGHVTELKSPGRQLTYEYDPLGRRTTVHRGTLAGPTIADWTYDTLKNGKGRLTKATRYEYDGSGNKLAYSTGPTEYNIDGQPAAVTVTIPSTEGGLCAATGATPCSFTTGYKYAATGDRSRVELPAAGQLPKEAVVLDFNNVGLSTGLFSVMSPTNPIYAQNGVYNQLDQLIGLDIGEFGRRVGVAYGFDEQTGRQRSMFAIPELKTDIYNLAYEYDEAGNLTGIKDTANGQAADTQCFRYDHQRRLTEAWTPTTPECTTNPAATALAGPAPYWRSYTYDAAGDRKTRSRTPRRPRPPAHRRTRPRQGHPAPNPTRPPPSPTRTRPAPSSRLSSTPTTRRATPCAGPSRRPRTPAPQTASAATPKRSC